MRQDLPGAKHALFAVLLAAGVLTAWRLGVFDPDFRERLQAFLQPFGPWAPIAYVAVVLAVVLLGLPLPPAYLAGGLLFGALPGGLLALAGAVAGACCTFWIGNGLGRDLIARHLRGRLAALDAGLEANGLLFTLSWRLMPVLPDSVLNYGAGLTRVRFRDYLLGTILGILAPAYVYAYVGSLATEFSTTTILLAIGALGLLAAIPIAVASFGLGTFGVRRAGQEEP